MKQHLILAALDEATRYPDKPVYGDDDLRNEGDGDARTVARNLMADCHQDDLRDLSVSLRIGEVLRRWIDRGATHLDGDHEHLYERSYAQRQSIILRVLDGDYETIRSLLEDARHRASMHYQEWTGE